MEDLTRYTKLEVQVKFSTVELKFIDKINYFLIHYCYYNQRFLYIRRANIFKSVFSYIFIKYIQYIN